MKKNMSQHGATLQTYNQELVKCLEDLKTKKNDLLQIVSKEEQEKHAIERNIHSLQERLSNINNNLQKHKSLCESYEKTIQDTESGFKKILESSQMLLNLAQQGASKLNLFENNTTCSKFNETNNYRYD